MDNIKILVLLIIILLIILLITILSDSCSVESLSNNISSEERLQFDLENFIKQNTNTNNKFVLAEKSLEFNILKDPSSISIDSSTDNKYLIYNSNKTNLLFLGSVDISGTQNNKAFVIIVLKNIYLIKDASGTMDPNFTVNSYVVNNTNSSQFVFNMQQDGLNDGKLKINTVDNSGNNVNIIKPDESSTPDNISGPNTVFNINDTGFNILNNSTLNKKQLISYNELQSKLRPCYAKNYSDISKQIIGLMVYLLQKHNP